MNNIDQFFRDKMNNEQQFPFREAHWDDALRLIEAAEKQRKRRGGFWQWSLLLLVSVAFGAGAWWWSSSNMTASTTRNNIATSANTASKTLTTVPSIDQTSSKLTETSAESNQVTTANVANSGGKKLPKRTIKGSAPNSTSTQSATPNTVTRPPNSSATTTDKNMVMVVETTATQQPTTVGQVSDTNNTQNTINTASNVAASTQNEAPIIAAKNAVTALPLLSPKWLTTETDMPPKATVDCPIMPRISPVWRFGLVADAYAPLQQRNQFGVGAVVSRTLGKHWRTETGLHYQMLLGTLPNTQQSNQILYSFGKSATAYQLTPSQIHRLMLPVSLQYTHGAHLAEVGGAVHYLAGVRGTIANSTSSETQRGWVGPTGLRTWNAGVFGGYRYRITPGLVVGLRVHYLPKGIWAANYDFGSGYTTTFSDKLSGNLSIYYYFKTRK